MHAFVFSFLKRTIHFSVIIFLKVSYENILKINETRTIDNYFFNRNHIVIQQLYKSFMKDNIFLFSTFYHNKSTLWSVDFFLVFASVEK